MSKSLIIEEESGVITRGRHPHNGYYAGDFSGGQVRELRTTYVAPRASQRVRPAVTDD